MERNPLILSIFCIIAVLLFCAIPSMVLAENVIKELDSDGIGLAIKGYDSVAYFTEGKAVRGSEKHTYIWNEAVWRFSKSEHKKLFAANPEKYVPHRGGW